MHYKLSALHKHQTKILFSSQGIFELSWLAQKPSAQKPIFVPVSPDPAGDESGLKEKTCAN